MKVWERGAGPTLACGTGACALTVAAVLAGKTDQRYVLGHGLWDGWIDGVCVRVQKSGVTRKRLAHLNFPPKHENTSTGR